MSWWRYRKKTRSRAFEHSLRLSVLKRYSTIWMEDPCPVLQAKLETLAWVLRKIDDHSEAYDAIA